MKVKLLSVTSDALNLLLRTKNTRLGFGEDPATWSEEKRAEHLAYMRDTIRSSWEFVDYTFEFEGVTRAFTHQLVRTRSGSYAQESQRTVDVRDHEVIRPALPHEYQREQWSQVIEIVKAAYSDFIDEGVPVQDARGILPTNTTTSIVAKFSLRTFAEMAKVRLCTRTQGEYQDAFRAARALVLEVHPWADEFLQVHCVAEGTCAFPRYGKASCRFYDPRMDLSAVIADTRAKFWSERQVATPRAEGGTSTDARARYLPGDPCGCGEYPGGACDGCGKERAL